MAKIADRPHLASILLSVLAIFISGGSAYFSLQSLHEARENRRLNEMTNRAAIEIVSVQRIIPGRREFPEWNRMPPHPRESGLMKVFLIKLRNTGKGTAKAVTVEYSTSTRPPGVNEEHPYQVYLPDMGPGQEHTFSAVFFPSEQDSRNIDTSTGEFVLEGNVSYADELTSTSKTERFCYSLFSAYLDGVPKDLETCQSNKPN